MIPKTTMKPYLFLIIIACAIFLSSCSGSDPLQMETAQNQIDIAESDLSSISSHKTVFGIYKVIIDETLLNVSMTPVVTRGASLGEQFLGDITSFLTSVYCQDCARIDGVTITEEGYIDVQISIRHPFDLPVPGPPTAKNRLDLHLFDAWGLIYTDTGVYFPSAGITVKPGFLVNADGYSGTYDAFIDEIAPSQNDHHPFKILFEDATEGNFDPESELTGFTDLLHPTGHNVFPQGSGFNSTSYLFNVEEGNAVQFLLVLTASYGVSARWDVPNGERGNRLTPGYFLPRFNRHEAWKIQATIPDYLNFLTSNDPTQTAQLRIDVWDWQDDYYVSQDWDFKISKAGEISLESDIAYIAITIPALDDELKIIDRELGSGTMPKQFSTEITNKNQVPPGKYYGIVVAMDEADGSCTMLGFKRDGRTPFLYNKIRTYQVFEIEVKSSSTAVPENPVDITPDGLNGCFDDLIINNGAAYVSAGVLGVMLFDITIPGSPQFLSSIDTDGYASKLAFDSERNVLYVADGENGVAIINVLNPLDPYLQGTFYVTGIHNVVDVTLHGTYAYVGDSSSGVAVVDVSNPSVPVFKTFYTNRPFVCALKAYGGFLYKLDTEDGMEILSLANPADPVLVNGLIVSGFKRDLDIGNGIAAILMDGRLVTADVSNPYFPVLKGTVSFEAMAESVFIIDNFAFVADGTAGLKVINMYDLANPAVLGGYDTPGISKGVFVQGHNVFIADGDTGMVILESCESELIPRGMYITLGNVNGIALNEQTVYLASGASGVRSVNVIPYGETEMLAYVNTPGYAKDCGVQDTMLYVADEQHGMAMLNITNPNQMTYTGNFQFPQWENWNVEGVEIAGNYAGLWGQQTGVGYPDMILLDASNATSPVQVGSLQTPYDFFDLTFQTGYIYAAAGWNGIVSVKATNPATLSNCGIYSNGKPCYSTCWGYGKVYAMFESIGLELLDVYDPCHLVYLGGHEATGYPYDVCLSGNYVYSNCDEGLIIFDITDPFSPEVVTIFELPSDVSEIIVRGNYAYVGAFDAGLRIIRLWQ